MITNFLTTQGVGSTSTESHQRTSPTKRSGDSFEAVLEKAAEKAEAKSQDLTKIDPKTDLADAEIVAEAEVDAADPEASAEGGTLEAEIAEEDVPAEELIAESEFAEKGDEVSQEEGLLYSDVPPQPSEAPKAMTATGDGLTVDQDSETVEEQLVASSPEGKDRTTVGQIDREIGAREVTGSLGDHALEQKRSAGNGGIPFKPDEEEAGGPRSVTPPQAEEASAAKTKTARATATSTQGGDANAAQTAASQASAPPTTSTIATPTTANSAPSEEEVVGWASVRMDGGARRMSCPVAPLAARIASARDPYGVRLGSRFPRMYRTR